MRNNPLTWRDCLLSKTCTLPGPEAPPHGGGGNRNHPRRGDGVRVGDVFADVTGSRPSFTVSGSELPFHKLVCPARDHVNFCHSLNGDYTIWWSGWGCDSEPGRAESE
ncbi:hypothetical protein Bbelb_233870 [Branchiostoma belcheri]|nr:hypothetical protein Bbelb_233870 [Branchiostoma belcheri]